MADQRLPGDEGAVSEGGVRKARRGVSEARHTPRLRGHARGRGAKPILAAGWLFGLPVPLLIIFAPDWSWVVFANVLLGINQGLCWSTTVIMKIDLVGPKQRGLAMGVKEVARYGA